MPGRAERKGSGEYKMIIAQAHTIVELFATNLNKHPVLPLRLPQAPENALFLFKVKGCSFILSEA